MFCLLRPCIVQFVDFLSVCYTTMTQLYLPLGHWMCAARMFSVGLTSSRFHFDKMLLLTTNTNQLLLFQFPVIFSLRLVLSNEALSIQLLLTNFINNKFGFSIGNVDGWFCRLVGYDVMRTFLLFIFIGSFRNQFSVYELRKSTNYEETVSKTQQHRMFFLQVLL